MPRNASIWWYKTHKCFYTTIEGKKVRLDPDRDKALKMFYKIKGGEEDARPVDANAVASVLDAFIDWSFENRAERTAERYKDFCQEFVLKYGRMKVSDLSPRHVQEWVSGKKEWNNTTKHNAIGALIRAFNWGVKNYGLKANPIHGMEKPKPNRRTATLTSEEFDSIVDRYAKDDPFRDLVTVSYDTGTRPKEIKRLEARHVELDKARAVIPSEEGKGGIQRAVYFTNRSLKIIKRLVKGRPEGLLFVSTTGAEWKDSTITSRFRRLEKHVGRRFNLYMFRHTSITRRLANGVDSHIVAKLHGHTNTQMLDKVYSHVADDYDFMRKQANAGETKKAAGASKKKRGK